MQHANLTILPTQTLVVSDPISLTAQDNKLPILSVPPSSANTATAVVQDTLDTPSNVCHASIFTQTTPTSTLPLNSDLEISIPISLWQTNAANLQSLQEHVNALLQRNFCCIECNQIDF